MNRLLFFITLILISTFSIVSTSAQGLPINGGGIILTMSTESPVPGQKITITARSYTIDINSSEVTWSIDDKIIQKGFGLTKMETIAPPLGKKVTVTVSASTNTGIKISDSITISPGSVDMIIEGDGYVTPLFQGKLPLSYQNTFRIIAVPHLADSKGVEYKAKDLVYQWKRNSRVIEEDSGYGKQTLSLTGDIVPREATISVTVSTRDGKERTTGYISVPYISPSVLFYEDDYLYGPLFNKTIKDTIIIGKEKELNVLMAPFGFNKPTKGLGDLNLLWTINGYEHPELSSNESITLRAPAGMSGSSRIGLEITNDKDILQNADNGFSIKFNSK